MDLLESLSVAKMDSEFISQVGALILWRWLDSSQHLSIETTLQEKESQSKSQMMSLHLHLLRFRLLLRLRLRLRLLLRLLLQPNVHAIDNNQLQLQESHEVRDRKTPRHNSFQQLQM